MRRALLFIVAFLLAAYSAQAVILSGGGAGTATPPSYDSKGAAATGTGELSWTHTPVGTPRGIVAYVVQYAAGDDQVTGATYGGVTMTEVTGSPLLKTTGEAMAVYAYFLGSSIPTGAQTVVVSVSGAATKRGMSIAMTAGGNTEINDVDATLTSDSAANPSATLSLGGVASFASIGFMSGHDAVGSSVALADWNNVYYSDFGTEVGGADRYNTVGTADVTIGHTQAAEDFVAIGVAVNTVGSVTDTTSPYTASFDPPNAQTGVSESLTSATFHVLDDGVGVDNTMIKATRTGGVIQSCGDNLVCTGAVGDITVTYPGLSLAYDDNVAFQIGASDTVPNAMDNVSYWFTVRSDPGAGGNLLVGDNTYGGSYIQATSPRAYTDSFVASTSGTAATFYYYQYTADATYCKGLLYEAGDTGALLDSVEIPVTGTGWLSGTLTGSVNIFSGTSYKLGVICNAWTRIGRDNVSNMEYCSTGTYASPPNPNCKTDVYTGSINAYITD